MAEGDLMPEASMGRRGNGVAGSVCLIWWASILLVKANLRRCAKKINRMSNNRMNWWTRFCSWFY